VIANRAAGRSDWTMAAALVGVLAVTVAPLPPLLFDLLLAAALCLAALTFLVAFYVERPTDFSAFPALLLFVTLFRLALNVASTRLILTHGGEGDHAAGAVIAAFGKFVVGGDLVVGAIIFSILVIVNFVVITKGAGRISEVAARFTLDGMPGKQMAIDADLNAGIIDGEQARKRRGELVKETEFYGAMDGASKFVRGDAVAGLIIGVALTQQLLRRRRPLMATAALLAVIGLVPGMPHLLFLSGAAGLAWMGRRRTDSGPAADDAEAPTRAGAPATPGGAPSPSAGKADLEAALPVELLAMEVGLDLLGMVDAGKNGELLRRIATLRKQLASELGLLVPPIHIRDDLRLAPGAYRVLLSGVTIAEGKVAAHRLLALDPTGTATNGIAGETTTEPTFGLPAKWIATTERARAEAAGATVVDPAAVVATHLAELIRRHAHELIGRREAQELLEIVGKTDGKLVEELIPHLLSTGDVIKVLRNLLREGVSIRDLRTILETLADHAGAIKSTDELTELVRQRMGRRITRTHLASDGALRPLVLDPRAEQLLREPAGRNARALARLTDELAASARDLTRHDEPPVVVVAPDLRRAVAGLAARHAPGLAVLSFREVDPAVPFVTRGVISALEAA
jgi:flagellar biosynthesis protein FlhA